MQHTKTATLLAKAGLVLGLTLSTAGCAYDYLQHTDRVAYSAGDAIAANLERETMQPSSDSMYDTTGLGQDGVQVPGAPVDNLNP